MNITDEKLIEASIQGDKKALELLIGRYVKPIYSFVFRYVGGANDAEDITQEVFVKIWKHLRRFNEEKSFKTWIFSVAKNTALDFLKKKKHISFSDTKYTVENIADTAPLPSELLKRRDIAQQLTEALDTLSPKYRMVLFLRYNDHFTFREIAESLNEPLHTVKSRHRRALPLLKKLLMKNSMHQMKRPDRRNK